MTWLNGSSVDTNRRRAIAAWTAAAWASAAAVLAAGLAPSASCAKAAPASDPLDLKGAHLGMSLETWKALPLPDPSSRRAQPLCTDHPGPAAGLLATATAPAPDTVVCAYFSRYGRYLLPDPVALDPRIEARRVRYVFRDGRLEAIEYHFSTNAYDDLTARLNALYGAAKTTVRDTVKTDAGAYPRVRATWSGPVGQVQLTDPVPPYTDLSIRLIGAAGKARGRTS